MAEARQDEAEASLGQLFASASRDFSTLIRNEVELAKAEVRQDVRNAAAGAAMFGAAGVFGAVAVVIGSVAAALGIRALGVTLGWSFLIVTGAYLVLALILVLVGVRSLRGIRPPERTIRTAKENVALLRSPRGGRAG